MPIRVG